MKQITLKSLLLVLTILMGGVNAWGETGSLTFGTNDTKISSSSVTASDNLGNSWTITTVGTTSFTQQPTYSQVGSKGNPATSITFATTLPSAVNITSFSVKLGGNSGTAGTISLKVDNTEIGTGSLNAANDVTVENNTSASGNVLTISVTGISRGVKVYNLSYTYESAGSGPSAPTFSLAEGTYWTKQTLELTTTVEGGKILYTTDKTDPTKSGTANEYSGPIQILETTTVKACVKVGEENFSAVAERKYTIVPSIANTPEKAYTTAEAIDLIDKTSAEQLAAEDQKVYVKGTVSKVDSYNSGSITYWLDDNTFEVYSGKRLDGANFDAMSDVEVGASVVVYGNVKKYGTTYEFDKNSSLVEYNRNTLSSISISGDPNRVTYEEGESFDWTGLTVTAIFTGENTVDVTNSTTWTVEPDVLTMETTSVTVTATYKDKVATKDIPVSVSKALPKVTIDLSKDETTTATTEKLEWVLDDIVVNSIRENSGNTAANNYYPGKSNSSTRFYKNNSFNVIPAYYVIIKQITYTATTENYAKALADSKWTNATASADGMTVTIVPEDGAQPITAIIGATTGASSIVVSYEIIDHAEVGLPATDGTANYATFSSDKDVEFVDATVYAVNVVNGVLQLNEVTSKQVPKGTGVLLKSEKETAPYFYIDEAAAIENNLLKPASLAMSGISGSYTFYKLAYDDYVAKTGLGFYWGADKGGVFNVKAGTAYLAVPNAVSVKGFLLDGTPTAIEGVEAKNNTDVIYNLSGQRVQKAQRGLYIVNGKKLMVK
ncbi:MAG: chitobiase/beta-hexosaminidase C-terminal domain-containing protein [Paraprevotella sp.]|nr:chitobiase/beta-hexosaminidase C-terminal domain-containing protein [Paraprevotella sp.]